MEVPVNVSEMSDEDIQRAVDWQLLTEQLPFIMTGSEFLDQDPPVIRIDFYRKPQSDSKIVEFCFPSAQTSHEMELALVAFLKAQANR